MHFKRLKGFSVSDIAPLALAVMIGAIVISLAGSILQDLRTQQGTTYGTSSVAYNVTTSGLSAMTTFGNWLPTVALVVVFSIIIGVIVVYLGGRAGRA
jgi:hypothetical protein